MSLSQDYSSVIINQNQAYDSKIVNAGLSPYAQEFHLPADYRRGTDTDEIGYPALSGFQLMVNVDTGQAESASFDYEVQYQVFGLGWVTATFGTAVGAPSDGIVWMTAAFDEPVEINKDKAEGRWRLRFGNGSGLTRFLVTEPNPLATTTFDRAYDTNGSVLNGTTEACAFNFRILALTAEEGLDFLGNQYRSVVTLNKADDVSTAMGADPDSYWLSKPNPSKFAVENLYFDVRKSGSTTYGRGNLILNPSFETGIGRWRDNIGGVTPGNLSITDAWSTSGSKSLMYSGTTGGGVSFPGIYSDMIKVKPGKTYTFRLNINVEDYPGTANYVTAHMRWWDVSYNSLGDSDVAIHSGLNEGELIVTGVAPPNANEVRLLCYINSSTSDTVKFYVDSTGFYEGTDGSYFDGDMEGYVWSNVAHDSASYELVQPSIEDTSTVIDRILVDPVTPGAYFNIYYTTEGGSPQNESEWDDKLWQRVPQTYRMERKETHVLPEPVRAKFVKIEFSHLQARHYAPGDFQQPVRYKKHPKWVLDYFLARMQTDAAFLSQTVRGIYDALDLAYNYYLDDIGDEPVGTMDANDASEVSTFLRDRTDASDRIDPVTLNKINLVMNQYRQHPALRGYSNTLIGDWARQTVNPLEDYPIEGVRASSQVTADVSSLNRDRVVIEQDYPVMFFYLTSRHKYREVEAKFTHDRAYFVGVRQVAFLRDSYMTAFDTTTYIEPAADTLNIERNEFV